jgi:hypothetical protein
MADITMCKGTDCPMKANCHRYTATPNEWRQSYFIEVPWDKAKGDCEHSWFQVGK